MFELENKIEYLKNPSNITPKINIPDKSTKNVNLEQIAQLEESLRKLHAKTEYQAFKHFYESIIECGDPEKYRKKMTEIKMPFNTRDKESRISLDDPALKYKYTPPKKPVQLIEEKPIESNPEISVQNNITPNQKITKNPSLMPQSNKLAEILNKKRESMDFVIKKTRTKTNPKSMKNQSKSLLLEHLIGESKTNKKGQITPLNNRRREKKMTISILKKSNLEDLVGSENNIEFNPADYINDLNDYDIELLKNHSGRGKRNISNNKSTNEIPQKYHPSSLPIPTELSNDLFKKPYLVYNNNNISINIDPHSVGYAERYGKRRQSFQSHVRPKNIINEKKSNNASMDMAQYEKNQQDKELVFFSAC